MLKPTILASTRPSIRSSLRLSINALAAFNQQDPFQFVPFLKGEQAAVSLVDEQRAAMVRISGGGHNEVEDFGRRCDLNDCRCSGVRAVVLCRAGCQNEEVHDHGNKADHDGDHGGQR